MDYSKDSISLAQIPPCRATTCKNIRMLRAELDVLLLAQAEISGGSDSRQDAECNPSGLLNFQKGSGYPMSWRY